MIWLLLSLAGLIGYGVFIGSMIRFGNPSTETPIVKHTAVLVCIVPLNEVC